MMHAHPHKIQNLHMQTIMSVIGMVKWDIMRSSMKIMMNVIIAPANMQADKDIDH